MKMKAMIITRFGGVEVFEERDIPIPVPESDEILVSVRATAINPVDYKLRRSGAWAGIEPPAVLGYDVAGVVEKVGSRVDRFRVGDEVFYTPELNGRGSYAEYHVVPDSIAAHKPKNLSFVEAASIPLAGCTAWDALIGRARLLPGEKVLIHGAGGVGSLAIQIAKAAGAFVSVTCGDYDFGMVRSLGADRSIDYRHEDFRELLKSDPVDVVLDTVGRDLLVQSAEVTRQFARMATIVSSSGEYGMSYHNNLTVHLVMLRRESAKLEHLKNLIEWGKVVPVIDSVLELADVAEAHRRLEKGKVKGKIVLRVG
jgi:NADPH2:quinone reductase